MGIAEGLSLLRLMEGALPLILGLWNGDYQEVTREQLLAAFDRADDAEKRLWDALGKGEKTEDDEADRIS